MCPRANVCVGRGSQTTPTTVWSVLVTSTFAVARIGRVRSATWSIPTTGPRALARPSGRLLLRIGFQQLSLHRVYATCHPRNVASAAILRKLGMTYEGRLRHTLLLRDGWADSELFSILEPEWSDTPSKRR